jgi:hypothetical protein
MSEYFQVTLPGGDDRPLFCCPSRSVEQIRAMYPQASSVIEVTKQTFLELCERFHRVTIV